jgi:outer membrane receptor protein involved in Fe transport
MTNIKHTISALCAALCFVNLQAAEIKTEKLDTVNLNEIVVLAARQQTQLKKLSGSVSVLSTNQIETLGIQSLTDATSTIANFFMPDYGSKLTSPVYIRGIGSRINSPSVGLYVDHVPYFEKAAFNFDFFDINRLEVLRGPQGTEYGRNNMGGIINIRTKSPLSYQGTDVNIQTGSYGTLLLNAGHYAKVSEKFAWSLALNYRHNDGFYKNEFLNENVDVLDSYGFRNRLIWLVNERFSIENIISYENSKQGGYPYAQYFSAKDSVAQINYNERSGYNRVLISDALLLKYDAKNFDFRATTSYQYLNDKQFIDQDFSADSLYFVVQNQNQNMFSQELIFQSKPEKRYQWILGAYGFSQQFYNDLNLDIYSQKLSTSRKYDHTISGAAIFHQSTINDFPVKNISISAGIRLDTEIDQMGYIFERTLNGNTGRMTDTIYQPLKSIQVLPKLSANYKLGNTNMYALVSKGYKTGGFNIVSERAEDLTFDPEYSWNYEIGLKSGLFNNKLYAEASVFYIDWKNQQIYKSTPSGTGSMLKNAGQSESKGFEMGLNTAPIYGFELMSSYGYTYATFLENKLNETVDYSGNYIPYVPRHTVAAQLRKTFNIEQSNLLNKIIFSALYKGTGEIYWNEANTAKQDFYNTVDARISFIRKHVQFDIWGTNLGSARYNAFYFEALGKQFVQTAKPMQAGVKLSVNF